jgi:ankyrin repeat protein
VKLLWDSGVPAKDKNSTLLVDSAKRDDTETIKRLLKEGADANAMDSLTGEKPLDVAANAANSEAVATLITGGANVNSPARDFPPIWQALSGLERHCHRKTPAPEVVERYLATMKILLAAGARPDVSIYGETPVSIAERYKCAPMVDLLKAAVEQAAGKKP